jgi:acetyltransferase-like isoleucine patch superfamily enzyme
VLETGQDGSIDVGEDTFLHPRCQIMAYKGRIKIGDHAMIAPNCALYAYNHSMGRGELIKKQSLQTRGGITIGDGAWLGYGVIVLDGVNIGDGAVIGAGSVVTEDIPPFAIAVGNPARIVSARQ